MELDVWNPAVEVDLPVEERTKVQPSTLWLYLDKETAEHSNACLIKLALQHH